MKKLKNFNEHVEEKYDYLITFHNENDWVKVYVNNITKGNDEAIAGSLWGLSNRPSYLGYVVAHTEEEFKTIRREFSLTAATSFKTKFDNVVKQSNIKYYGITNNLELAISKKLTKPKDLGII
jgi:hypothetical protein